MNKMMMEILSLVALGSIVSVSFVFTIVSMIMGSTVGNVVFFVCCLVSFIAFVHMMHKIEEE